MRKIIYSIIKKIPKLIDNRGVTNAFKHIDETFDLRSFEFDFIVKSAFEHNYINELDLACLKNEYKSKLL